MLPAEVRRQPARRQNGFLPDRRRAQIAHAGLHQGEEPPISGTRGSGTIFFAGCNLRCVFCQNHQISQEFQPSQTKTLTTEALADEMLRLADAGATTSTWSPRPT